MSRNQKIRLIPTSQETECGVAFSGKAEKWIDPITNQPLSKSDIRRIEGDMRREAESLKHASKKEESLLKRFLIID